MARGYPPWTFAAPRDYKAPPRFSSAYGPYGYGASSPPRFSPALGPVGYGRPYTGNTNPFNPALGPVGYGQPTQSYKPIVHAGPGRGAGAAAPFPGYLTPEQILAQATEQVNASYNPTVAAYQGFISDLQAANDQKIATLRSALQQAVQSLSGAPEEALGFFRSAASDQAAIAGGFTGDLHDTIQGQADQINQLLQSIGAPSGQQIPGSQAENVANVAYGLGGYLNAATLEGQGIRAAQQAAAIPGQIWSQGLGLISQYQQDETAQEQQYRQQITLLAAQKPADIQKAVADINAQQGDLLKQAKNDTYKQAQIRLTTMKTLQDIADARTKNEGFEYVVTKDGQVKLATDRNGKPIRTLAGQKADQSGQPGIIKYQDGLGIWHAYNPVTGESVRLPGAPKPDYQKARIALAAGRLKLDAAKLKAQVARDNNTAIYHRTMIDIRLADQNSKQDGSVWVVGPKGPHQLLDDKGRPVPTIGTKVAQSKLNLSRRAAALAWARVYGTDPTTGLLTLEGQKAIEAVTGYIVDRHGIVVTGKDGKPIMTAPEADKAATRAAAAARDARVAERDRIRQLNQAGYAVVNGKVVLKPGYTQASDGAIVPPGYTYDPGTQTYTRLGTGTKAKKPIATPKMIAQGWKQIQQGKTGWWASQTDASTPLTTDQFRSLVKDAGYDSIAAFQTDLKNAADDKQREQIEDKVGIQYSYGDPQEIYLDLVHQGIPAKRAWTMVRKEWPTWGANYFGPKASAAASAATDPVNPKRWVYVAKTANRAGVNINSGVLDFVARIGAAVKQKLQISTGSNHNQFVAGEPGHQSQHWTGDAADIPAVGKRLLRLGRQALILAGMDPAEAMTKTGGAFTVNGYNILFNTMVGGNHYNHLHVGLTGDAETAEIAKAGGPAASTPEPSPARTTASATPTAETTNPAASVGTKTIKGYLVRARSPLAGQAGLIVQLGNKYKIDPRFLIAIMSAESSLGLHPLSGYNPFGWLGKSFSSWSEALRAWVPYLRNNYFNKGVKTLEGFRDIYAPLGADNDPNNLNANWVPNVSSVIRSLGGDPERLTL